MVIKKNNTLIFEQSKKDRYCPTLMSQKICAPSNFPSHFLRETPIGLPALSELQVVRHYTQLSHRNFAIDHNFYPLGSCTMKYNPKIAHQLVMQKPWCDLHPMSDVAKSQGLLQCLYELQVYLCDLTGMNQASLTPMAGAQGEFAGVAMIKAYHEQRGDLQRCEILIPEAAHGTNPASAMMCGYKVREIPVSDDGDLDLVALKQALSSKTAGLMLTNPSTLGVFERQVNQIAKLVHDAGGLLYYDGANLNAILGQVRPADMGFDVMHVNLHKTFATPHGGGGPGAGPVLANSKLAAYLPIPYVMKGAHGYQWAASSDCPQSIGRLSAFMGNTGVLLRAYAYIRLLGRSGLADVARYAALNANYVMKGLQTLGYDVVYSRRASHEFVISLVQEKKTYGVSALDVGKRLLDFGIHAPTMYFPLMIPECLLIEPTETESKDTLDEFIEVMRQIRQEMQECPEILRTAPHQLPIKRLDEVKAARQPVLVWKS